MNAFKDQEETLCKTVRKLYQYNLEAIARHEGRIRHQNEWFDKDNLSEDDIDRIWADV